MAKAWKVNQARFPNWKVAVQQAADDTDLDLAQQGWGNAGQWIKNSWNKVKAKAKRTWNKVKAVAAKAMDRVKHWATQKLDQLKTAAFAKLNKFIAGEIEKFSTFMKGKTYNCDTLKTWVNEAATHSSNKHTSIKVFWPIVKPLLSKYGEQYVCKPFESLICKEGDDLISHLPEPAKDSLQKVKDTINNAVHCKKLIELLDIEPEDHPLWPSFVASHEDFSDWKDAWNARKAADTGETETAFIETFRGEAIQTQDTWVEQSA
jgi:hypothetical protein